jgi:hypothetical protein
VNKDKHSDGDGGSAESPPHGDSHDGDGHEGGAKRGKRPADADLDLFGGVVSSAQEDVDAYELDRGECLAFCTFELFFVMYDVVFT